MDHICKYKHPDIIKNKIPLYRCQNRKQCNKNKYVVKIIIFDK